MSVIVHFGLGAFFRAHLADYTADAGGWSIEAVAMRDPALAQSHDREGYTLLIRAPGGTEAKRIACVSRCWHAATEGAAIADRLANPKVQIATLTITEKGYGAALPERRLNTNDPAIAHDLAHPDTPTSAVGILVAGLARRRAAGQGGLTCISCDNLPDNGHLLRALVQEFAQRTQPGLWDWISTHCTFPTTMVDRITPASTAEVLAEAGGDPWATQTEPFRQWVIEDAFAGTRPAWERAGAEIVPDVAPYEEMKLRMLNGAHSLLAYVGCLAGLEAVRDVMAVPALRAGIAAHMDAAARTLAPGLDTDRYRDALLTRFDNPSIRHLCRQIAMDGSQKLPQRILAPAQIAAGKGDKLGTYATAFAAWLVFAGREGTALQDPEAQRIAAFAPDMPARLEDAAALFGADHKSLFTDPAFRAEVEATTKRLTTKPPEEWLQS